MEAPEEKEIDAFVARENKGPGCVVWLDTFVSSFAITMDMCRSN